MTQEIFFYIDLLGTFAFAISGTVAAINRHLDIFGICVVTFVTACGGGIIRDLCIGSLPPAGLVNIYYLIAIFLAIFLAAFFQKLLLKLTQPTLFFDAIGLGFFAAFGAHKTFLATANIELSIIMGVTSAVGGGAIRDILLGRIPVILTKEIYASAAIIGASTQVLGDTVFNGNILLTWLSIIICTAIRLLSLKYKWNLPSIKIKTSD